jgi:hypothetical protein
VGRIIILVAIRANIEVARDAADGAYLELSAKITNNLLLRSFIYLLQGVASHILCLFNIVYTLYANHKVTLLPRTFNTWPLIASFRIAEITFESTA